MKRIMIVAAVLASAGPVFAQEEPTGSWADETSAYYFARGGCATDGTYIYFFGGYQLGVSSSYPSYYRRARRYDPANDAWTTLANLPIVESSITYQYNAGAYYDGRLYSFGTSYEEATGIVLTYSLADNAWSVLESAMPGARYGAAAAVLGGRIYIAGGFGDGPSRRVDAFDPSDNSFTRVADLPAGRHLHAMTAVPSRDSLYVVGGMSDNGYEATCFEYAPSTNAWTERAPISTGGVLRPRGNLAAFTLRNRVYATGGRSDSGTSAAVFEYQPSVDAWTQRASMASGRYQHGAVAVGGRGYVYGGLPVYTEGEAFTPPDFGPGPELDSAVVVQGSQPESSLQAKEDAGARDGWTHRFVSFRAVVSDPDPDDLVRLKVRIRRPGEPVWDVLESGLSPQGAVEINFTLPTKGSYDWEYRIEDAAENSFPAGEDAWLPAFGNESTPDLRCDFTPPTDPVSLSPADIDVAVGDPREGDVVFTWTGSVEDGPASGLTYELEIARDGSPVELEPPLIVPAGTSQVSKRLEVGSELRYWRVRARDIAGNVSSWSAARRFRVTYDDRLDHAAGDADKSCGYGAGPGAPGAAVLIAALAIAVSAIVNRRRRAPMKY